VRALSRKSATSASCACHVALSLRPAGSRLALRPAAVAEDVVEGLVVERRERRERG